MPIRSDMTQIDIAALVADREAGTKGPWVASQSRWPEQIGCCPLIGRPVSIHNPATHLNVAAANNDADARRIARVPDMEAAIIAQDAELKRLRRRMEMQSKYFLRDAKQALAGDHRALRNRVEMMEAEPLEIVLSDDARAALGEKP